MFIDYDNLERSHKSSGIYSVVTSAVLQVSYVRLEPNSVCDVRVYGGWYEEARMTQLAQDVSIAVQRDFPAVIRVPLKDRVASFVTKAELAVSLLEEPSHHLFNTYRRKGKPANIRVQLPSAVGCADTDCPLPHARKLLKSGKCPNPQCVISSDDLVYRHEQKIVDTMLTCDMIYAASSGYDQIVLVSGDDDFLPPIRTMLMRGKSVVRFHPKKNRSNTSNLKDNRLVEIDL